MGLRNAAQEPLKKILRNKFFIMSLVKRWNRLLREDIDAPFPVTFKVNLDGALSNLIELKMSLLVAGGLD